MCFTPRWQSMAGTSGVTADGSGALPNCRSPCGPCARTPVTASIRIGTSASRNNRRRVNSQPQLCALSSPTSFVTPNAHAQRRATASAAQLLRVRCSVLLGVKLRCSRQSGKVNFHFASGQLFRLPAMAGNVTVVYSPPPRIPENFPVPSVISKLPGAGATRE